MENIIFNIGDYIDWIKEFFIIFIRMSGMVLIAPIIGSRLLPIRIKIVFALCVSISIVPLVSINTEFEILSIDGILIILQQIIVGLSIGFLFQMIFSAIAVAGESIALTMGLGFAQLVDPQNGAQVPLLSQFFIVITVLLFLTLDIHILFIQLLGESFSLVPIKNFDFNTDFIWGLLQYSASIFVNAVIISIPILIGLLIINITMGVMTRASPQLNIFAVGFPITLLIGFVLILMSIPALLPKLSAIIEQTAISIQAIFGS